MLVAMFGFRGVQSQRVAVPWFLAVAISALGGKTSLACIAEVRFSYVLTLIVETLFLLGIAFIHTLFTNPLAALHRC